LLDWQSFNQILDEKFSPLGAMALGVWVKEREETTGIVQFQRRART
jgi:hypothetical protein